MAFNYGDVVRALLGNNPNPYARLDIGNGLKNMGRNIQNRWDNWAMYNLPQGPGMQKELFQEWYPDDSQAKYDLMRRYYGM